MNTTLADIAERLATFRAQLTRFDGEYQSVETKGINPRQTRGRQP